MPNDAQVTRDAVSDLEVAKVAAFDRTLLRLRKTGAAASVVGSDRQAVYLKREDVPRLVAALRDAYPVTFWDAAGRPPAGLTGG